MSCGGSVSSIVSHYILDDRGSIPGRGKGFFLQPVFVYTSSEAHPASYSKGILGPFPGIKCGRSLTLTSPPYSAYFKNE
jgi:hypothetical protein